MHLITQERHSEAKRLMELYQKLKGIPVFKNRDRVVHLMYELFDKEVTKEVWMRRKKRGDIKEKEINGSLSLKSLPPPEENTDTGLEMPGLKEDYEGLKEEIHKGVGKLPILKRKGDLNLNGADNKLGMSMKSLDDGEFVTLRRGQEEDGKRRNKGIVVGKQVQGGSLGKE